MRESTSPTFFKKNEAKALPFRLIKKKRVTWLINKNRAKTDTTGAEPTQQHSTKTRLLCTPSYNLIMKRYGAISSLDVFGFVLSLEKGCTEAKV
jgi:hypothetical protein